MPYVSVERLMKPTTSGGSCFGDNGREWRRKGGMEEGEGSMDDRGWVGCAQGKGGRGLITPVTKWKEGHRPNFVPSSTIHYNKLQSPRTSFLAKRCSVARMCSVWMLTATAA